jgi:hypothetical protein
MERRSENNDGPIIGFDVEDNGAGFIGENSAGERGGSRPRCWVALLPLRYPSH